MQFHFNDFSQKLGEINVCNSEQSKTITRNFWAFQNIHTVEVKPYSENVYFEQNDF